MRTFRSKKVFHEDLKCYACGKKLTDENQLFDTAWRGVYWCGYDTCAVEILTNHCEELDADDDCNFEMEETE